MFHNKGSGIQFLVLLSLTALVTSAAFAGFSIRPIRPGETRLQIWKDGKIPYVFAPGVPEKARLKALEAMAQWETKTKKAVRFVPWKNENDFVQIDINEKNDCGGEAEKIGNRGGKNRVLYSVGGCPAKDSFDWLLFLPEHELGHAIGLYHEHQRHDRDDFIQVTKPFVTVRGFEAFANRGQGVMHGAYDFNSVMNYGSCYVSDCSKNPLRYLKKNGERVHASLISDGDVQTVIDLYKPSK